MNWNVWPILHCNDVVVYNFLCHVNVFCIQIPLFYVQIIFDNISGNSSTPICAASKLTCYKSNSRDLRVPKVTKGVKRALNYCNCMPACMSLSYTAEKFAMEFDYRRTFSNFDRLDKIKPGLVNDTKRFNITDQPG